MTNPDETALPIVGSLEDVIDRGFTAREHAAIQLRVPDSGTDWLDAMIRQSLRQEFAGKAMQGTLASDPDISADELMPLLQGLMVLVDAILVELEKKS